MQVHFAGEKNLEVSNSKETFTDICMLTFSLLTVLVQSQIITEKTGI